MNHHTSNLDKSQFWERLAYVNRIDYIFIYFKQVFEGRKQIFSTSR